MTVKLRPGIYWSDGVEFTADDVVFTIETHLKTDGLVRSAQVQLNVDSISAPDPYTVVFKLKKPNSRFHALFTVRWNAMWIMPKHVFERSRIRCSSTSTRRSRSGPTCCTATTRTAVVHLGRSATTGSAPRSPGSASRARSYVTYIDPGPPDKRVIAQLNHELDIIHDIAPEGMFTLSRSRATSQRLVRRASPMAIPIRRCRR